MDLAQVILTLSAAFTFGMFFAWRWARRVQHDLRGRPGYEFARIIATIIGWYLIVRLIGMIASVMVGFNHENFDAILSITGVLQVWTAIVLLWAAFRIRGLQRDDSDLDTSSPEPSGEFGEGIGVEIDQVGPDSAVAVDDPNGHAAID